MSSVGGDRLNCPYCQHELNDTHKFCTICGRQVIKVVAMPQITQMVAYENRIEPIERNSQKMIRLLHIFGVIIFIIILFLIGFISNRVFSYHIINKSYESMIKNIETNYYTDAYIDLEKIKDYKEDFKDVQTIEAYLDAKTIYETQGAVSCEAIQSELNQIRNDFTGDMSRDIQTFKAEIQEERKNIEEKKLNHDIGRMKEITYDKYTYSIVKSSIESYTSKCPVIITDNYIYLNQSEPTVSISTKNKSNKVVTYHDIIFFCYDAENRPVLNEYGLSTFDCQNDFRQKPNDIFDGTEWCWTIDELDFMKTQRFVPVITYVGFEDGSSWQLPHEVQAILQIYADHEIEKIKIDPV